MKKILKLDSQFSIINGEGIQIYAAKFVQNASTDEDGKEVPHAPGIVNVLVYRKSFLLARKSNPAFMSLF